MNYTWNNSKRISNLRKHQLDFVYVACCAWHQAIIIADNRKDYGEIRDIAYIPFFQRLTVVVFVENQNSRRIISWRKANTREVMAYEQAK